jgi:hypothetical protein
VRSLLNWLERLRQPKVLLLIAVVLFTEFVYFAIISVGKFDFRWPIQMLFYDQLADGMRQGNLYLPNGPHPQLIAQPNPYDPINMHWWNLDATYYKGRYYIYWGPFPAIIQLLGKKALGIQRTVGDQYLVFLFFSLMAVFSVPLVDRMARRLSSGIPPWLIGLCVLGLGLANPVTFLLASAGVYQAAIAGGQAFLFLGIIFAFDAVWETAHGERRTAWLLLAGIAWSMAIASRLSIILAVAPIVLITLVCTCVTEELRYRRFILDGLWVGTPIFLTILALLLYNKVRFDEWFEFGIKYQLSAFPYRADKSYILPNIDAYLFRAPLLECNFPYLYATLENGSGPILNALGKMPKGYFMREPTIGLLYVVPLVYAGPIALVAAWRRLGPGLFAGADAAQAGESRQRRAYIWFVVAMLLAALGPGYLDATIYTATMRYQSDFANGLILLSILGIFTWYGQLTVFPFWRWLRVSTTVLMVTVTVVCGVLLGYQGYMPYFKNHNPELHQKIVPALSFCGGRETHW